MAAQRLNFREPDAVIVLILGLFGGEAGFRVSGKEGNGIEQSAAFGNAPLEPAQPDIKIAQATSPVGGNPSPSAVELHGHALEDGDSDNEVKPFQGLGWLAVHSGFKESNGKKSSKSLG